MKLTKDADTLACSMYKAYLGKRNAGISKKIAIHFEPNEIATFKLAAEWTLDDIKSTEQELQNAELGTRYRNGGFKLNDQFIIYMENRFSDKVEHALELLSKIIP